MLYVVMLNVVMLNVVAPKEMVKSQMYRVYCQSHVCQFVRASFTRNFKFWAKIKCKNLSDCGCPQKNMKAVKICFSLLVKKVSLHCFASMFTGQEADCIKLITCA
jgi:hypothetical protein